MSLARRGVAPWAASVGTLLLLMACGQKGPLVLPGPPSAAAAAPVAPATAASAAQAPR